jgi:hypothetical protein
MDKKKWISFTKIFMLSIGVIIVIVDSILALNGIKGDTISEVALFYGIKSGFVPGGLGYVLGHLFWPRKYKVPFVASIFFAIAYASLAHLLQSHFHIVPIIWVVIGIVIGSLLWPQERKQK